MEVVWTRFMSLLAIWLVTGSPSVVGVNGEVLQKKDSSPKDLGLGKVLELLQLMESKLERNAKEVQVETIEVETRASILKRVGKLANPFEDHECNKTKDILQSDTFSKGHSNKTSFSNVTSGGGTPQSDATATGGGAQQQSETWTVDH